MQNGLARKGAARYDACALTYCTMATSTDAGSLKRGVQLLKILATAGPRGLSLTEIATRAALPHPSVHRVLQQLSNERLVDRHAELRRYGLGDLPADGSEQG